MVDDMAVNRATGACKGFALCAVLSSIIAGCSTAQGQGIRQGDSIIQARDGITVVLDYRGGSQEDAEKLEKSVGDCVIAAIESKGLPLRFVTPSEFRKEAFPDMNITSAPRSVESIRTLTGQSQFRRAIDRLNLRYYVFVSESTRYQDEPVMVGGGYPPVAVLMGAAQMKETELLATVLDLHRPSDPKEMTSHVTDWGYCGFVFIVPVLIPAMTEAKACEALGRTIVEHIMRESTKTSDKAE
mgnify:FL=1